MKDTAMDFALIGPGRLGLRLAQTLVEAGWRCTKIRGRRSSEHYDHRRLPPDTPWDSWTNPTDWNTRSLIFVTVDDSSIETVSEALVRELPAKHAVVLHTSGLLTSESLKACRAAGAGVGSWHPLQSFPTDGQIEFSGVPCAIEGDEPAVKTGFHVAQELGLEPWIIDRKNKALYHAAASIGANLSHILISAACEILSSCGPLPSPPGTVLAPLIRTSLERALEGDGLDGLTGPIARGDTETIQRHLEALPEELRLAYEALARYAQKL